MLDTMIQRDIKKAWAGKRSGSKNWKFNRSAVLDGWCYLVLIVKTLKQQHAWRNNKKPGIRNWFRAKRIRRRPTLPHSCPCSTIGAEKLNFRVRDGNGCYLFAIAAEKLLFGDSIIVLNALIGCISVIGHSTHSPICIRHETLTFKMIMWIILRPSLTTN